MFQHPHSWVVRHAAALTQHGFFIGARLAMIVANEAECLELMRSPIKPECLHFARMCPKSANRNVSEIQSRRQWFVDYGICEYRLFSSGVGDRTVLGLAGRTQRLPARGPHARSERRNFKSWRGKTIGCYDLTFTMKRYMFSSLLQRCARHPGRKRPPS